MLKETNVFLGGKTFLLHASNIYPKRLKKKEKRVDYDNERLGTIAFIIILFAKQLTATHKHPSIRFSW